MTDVPISAEARGLRRLWQQASRKKFVAMASLFDDAEVIKAAHKFTKANAPHFKAAAALRMRPDEIHLAEIRGAEGFAFLRAVGAGHPGSLTTWHADEGQEITALVAMVKQHEAGRALDDVAERIRAFVDIIAWCSRGDDGFKAPRVWLRAEEDMQHA